MLYVDSPMRQCYPLIGSWMADYFKNIHLESFKLAQCHVCEAPKSSFVEGNSSSWQLRHFQLDFQHTILTTLGDEMESWEAIQSLDDRAVGTSVRVFWNIKCTSPTTIIVLNPLHSINIGILKHLMNWVTSFLEQQSRMDKVNPHWAMMPQYPNFG